MKTMLGGACTGSANSLPAPEASAAAPSAAPRSIDRREISDGLMLKSPPTGISGFAYDRYKSTAPEVDCGATGAFALKVEALRKKRLYLQASGATSSPAAFPLEY